MQSAKGLLRDIYRSGFAYKKAGVILLDLAPASSRQGLLFEEHANPRRREFVDAVEEWLVATEWEGSSGEGRGIGKQWKMRWKCTAPRLHHLLEGYTRGYLENCLNLIGKP